MPELTNPLEPEQPVKIMTYTYPVDLFPRRNAAYKRFAEIVPRKKNPEALRQIFLKGWEQAKEEIDDWLTRSENSYDKTVPPPIDDDNTDTSVRIRYKIYFKRTDVYTPILNYMVALPNGHVRQKFALLALVRGLEREGTLDLIRPMLAQKGT